MKASLVFVGTDNVSYPNIHGKVENYHGGLIMRKMQGDSFKNILSRYLAMMKLQLGNAQTTVQRQDYIEALNDALFTTIEASIEDELARQYNLFADGINASYQTAVRGLQSSLLLRNKADAVAALNLLISLFKDYDNENTLIKAVLDAPLTPVHTKLGDLIKVNNFIKMIDLITEGDAKFFSQWLSSLLTAPSEALAAIIDAKATGIADDEVLNFVSKSSAMVGTLKRAVTANFGLGGTKDIDTKAADVHLLTRNIRLNETFVNNKYELNLHGDITVDPYGSVKAYRSLDSVASLTSYSGRNSILIATLHLIYGNNDLSNYLIYNTLAFQSYKSGNVLDKNYRIMRSDMIAEMAEKYLIGFDTGTAQSIIIHNYKAYPVLGILAAVAELAREKTLNGDNYGSVSHGDIFSIAFSTTGPLSVLNEFIGKRPNQYLKTARVKRVKAAIDSLATSGRISFTNLDKYLSLTGSTLQGISLKGIIPS